ncbi:MAG: hypothetical protein GXC73_17195, partial [Chitinophagaceae bacterium]|nr:hypothetical protein [Chitinophagaceae bacterium]
MPFKSNVRLNRMIDQVLHDPEILFAFATSGVSESHIKNFITAEPDKAWLMAVSDIEEYDNALKRQYELEEELAPMYELENEIKKKPEIRNLKIAGITLIIVVLFTWRIGYFSLNIIPFFSAEYYKSKNFFDYSLPIAVPVLTLLFAALLIQQFITRTNHKKKKLKLVALKSDPLNIEKENEIKICELAKVASEISAENKIKDKYIKETIREKLNSYINDSYSIHLQKIDAPGLAQIIDPARSVDTDSKLHIDFLLENMPGGSIGIAGSRGAGKSTLMNMYCGNNRVIETINGKKILPVLSSAPVQYDAREFILHLFSATCKSFLKSKGLSLKIDPQPALIKPNENEYFFRKTVYKYYKKTLPYFSITGLLLFTLGIILALNQVDAPALKEVEKVTTSEILYIVIKTLDLKPGNFLFWGLVLLIPGYTLLILNLNSLVSSLKRNSINKNPVHHNNEVREPIITDMVPIARNWLQKIKFQQSFTTGWAGAFKLPIGLEGELNKAYTFAENQLSNPEIIAGFTDFLQKLPQDIILIIGIDELDKIETDEKAQNFLNEIKSIFGLPRCFFLISVSENAMSLFERRGLPFRDVFDSSFDHIVYVDYLNLETSISLLKRRVI